MRVSLEHSSGCGLNGSNDNLSSVREVPYSIGYGREVESILKYYNPYCTVIPECREVYERVWANMGEYGPARANRGEVDRDGWTMVVRWIAIQFPVGAFGASRSQLEPVEGQMLGVGVAWGEERGTGGRERGARRRCDWVAGQVSAGPPMSTFHHQASRETPLDRGS